jgi:hypothetical protein
VYEKQIEHSTLFSAAVNKILRESGFVYKANLIHSLTRQVLVSAVWEGAWSVSITQSSQAEHQGPPNVSVESTSQEG